MKFFKLFEPLKINSMVLSNRIVMPAMHLNLANKGYMTKKLSDFYVERAKGGTGFIIIGGMYVDLYGMGIPMMLGLDNDDFNPKLIEFTNAIHEANEDAKVCAQLYHSGRYTYPIVIGKPPIGPSEVYTPYNKTTPRAMTLEDIENEKVAFADAALRAKKTGFDCVELCGSAGYLMGQFLSPLANIRTDEYGGSFENRVRFPVETINTVRSKLGNDYPFGYRMAGDDFVPGSNTYKEMPAIGKALEKAGVDYLNVTGGWHETRTPQLTMDVPEGCYTYLAENIKKSVSIPVFSSNRIVDPIMAEEILMAGKADAICIGRGLIADPNWAKKAQKGNIHDIMYCVACNQGCFDNVFRGMPITCLRNARAGNEARMKIKPLKEKKKVMIIGSGPGGLEAARVARIRGHEVHVFEKDVNIGGLLNIIWLPPGRNEFKKMIENYHYWIEKLGINLHLKTEVDINVVRDFNPDIVLLATGSKPIKVPIPGIDKENVYWANDAFTMNAPIGENNVIIGGGPTGIELAIYIAKYGRLSLEAFDFLTFYKALEPEKSIPMLMKGNKKVTVLEKLPRVGLGIGKSTKWVLLGKCQKLGVDLITNANIIEIGENSVSYIDASNNEQVINDVDAVYYATGVTSNDSLFKEIKTLEIPIQKVGDARKPQTVLEAVERGFKVANKI
jgi:2,4-dienoyl-CoA reductase (NADPH2)